jgi:DNA-binding PadR family transcriptional regulator
MTKHEILEGFLPCSEFVSPDALRGRLNLTLDRRSVYSYLQRLTRQGLLEKKSSGRGSLTYRLTSRGLERLQYFRHQSRS